MWLAGGVDNALRRVLRLADGWFPLPNSPEQLRSTTGSGWKSWERKRGGTPGGLARAVYVSINVNDDAVQAEREMRAFMEGYYNVSYETMVAVQPPYNGPAAGCIEWLQAFVERGAETVVVRFGAPDQTAQQERFAAEVLAGAALSKRVDHHAS